MNVKNCYDFVMILLWFCYDFVTILLLFCYDFVWPKENKIILKMILYTKTKQNCKILTKITETKQNQNQNADAYLAHHEI